MRLLRLAALLFVVGALPGTGAGDEEPETRTRRWDLRETPGARFAVEEARRLLGTGDLERALGEAQKGLERHADDLYLTHQEPTGERWRRAGEVLTEMLLALPGADRARYDDFVAPAARPLVERAIARSDVAALEDLRRRFGASSHGLAATQVLLARAHEAGDLRRAVTLAEEVTSRAPRDATAWWLRIDVLARLGDAAGLAALALPEGLGVEVAGRRVDLRAWLDERRAGVKPAAGGDPWPTWGGRADRTGRAPAAGRALGLRWSLPLALHPREQDQPGRDTDGDSQTDFVALLDAYRPSFPAADARHLYVSDGRTLKAIDLFGGRVVWKLEDAQPGLQLLGPRMLARGRSAIDRPFAPTLWNDRVIATVEVQNDWREDRVMGTQVNSYPPRRVLVAVSRSDGRLLWRAGQHPLDRDRLRRVHVCAEPAVIDDVVVCVGSRYESYEQTSLFGFDARTGRLRWETPFAYGQQETNLFGNPVKEFSAGAVSGRDGHAYAVSGLGCLASVRVEDGRLDWISSYEIQPIHPVQMWFQPNIRLPFVGPTAPLVTTERVVVAAGDAVHINCFDRATGRLAWRVPMEEVLRIGYGSIRQVLGIAPVRGQDAVIVTSASVQALDVATGRLVARGRFDPELTTENGDGVRGQGVIRGREVLVPTTLGLQRFALDGELKLLGRDPWPEGAEPGNLLALGSVLVVTGREQVQAHYAWEEIEKDLARRRRERPNDAEVLLEAGDLYLRGRGPTEARGAYRAAREAAPPGSPLAERARRGLFEAWMIEGRDRAQAEPVRGAPAWREALALAAHPAERVEARLALDDALVGKHEERVENLERLYDEAAETSAEVDDLGVPVRVLALLRLSRVEEDARRGAQAVDALQRLIERHGPERLGDENAAALATRRIEALKARFGAEAYARHESQARAALGAAERAGDAARLSAVLARWPNADVVPTARLSLATALLGTGKAEQARRVLEALVRENGTRPEARDGLLLLARAYGGLGATGARRAALAALAELPAEPPVHLDGRPLPPAEAARLEGGPAPEPTPETSWTARLVEREAQPRGDEELTLPLAVTVEEGERPTVALTRRDGGLRVFDLVQGRTSFEIPAAQGHANQAAHSEGTLVLGLRGEVRGVDATGATRWSSERFGSVSGLAVSRGIVLILGQRRSEQGVERVLEACDAATGLHLWSLDLGEEPVIQLEASGPHVVLSRLRNEARTQRKRLSVVDVLSGGNLREIDLPSSRDLSEVLHQGLVLCGGEGDTRASRRVTAVDLARGKARWSVTIPGASSVNALVPDGDGVWVLQGDGTLLRLARADGSVVTRTRIATGEHAHPRPAGGTAPLIVDGRLVLLALGARAGSPLLAFDLSNGKLAWELDAGPLVLTHQHAVVRQGDALVVMLAGEDRERARRVLVRVVGAADGRVRQTIESIGAPQAPAGLFVGPGGLLLVSGGAAVLHAAPSAASKR